MAVGHTYGALPRKGNLGVSQLQRLTGGDKKINDIHSPVSGEHQKGALAPHSNKGHNSMLQGPKCRLPIASVSLTLQKR